MVTIIKGPPTICPVHGLPLDTSIEPFACPFTHPGGEGCFVVEHPPGSRVWVTAKQRKQLLKKSQQGRARSEKTK